MENNRSPRKCLLIIPTTFYSFAQILANGLRALGFEVAVSNDEYPSNAIGKILGKLHLQVLLAPLTRRALYARYIEGRSYELVLIVKGRGMGKALLDLIARRSPNIVGYNFDSFGYHSAPLAWCSHVRKYCTFDYVDADRHGLPLVDLFSSLPRDDAPKQIDYDVSAILRNHSDRLEYLDAVLGALGAERTFVYIYEQNVVTFVQNFLKNPRLYLKYRKHISFKSLPYADYVSVLRRSEFTVDYAHPKQSGITMRCFEALSAQTKIITNNGHVRRNPHFDAANTIVFARDAARGPLAEAYARLRHASTPAHHRSVTDFLQELIR